MGQSRQSCETPVRRFLFPLGSAQMVYRHLGSMFAESAPVATKIKDNHRREGTHTPSSAR
jgi:hypothetical protein